MYNVQCTMYNVQCTMYNVHVISKFSSWADQSVVELIDEGFV